MIGNAGDVAVSIVAIGHRSVVGVGHLQELVQTVIAVGRLMTVAVGQARHSAHPIVGERLRFERAEAGEGYGRQVALAVVAKTGRVVFAILFAGDGPIGIVRIGSSRDTSSFVRRCGEIAIPIIRRRRLLARRIRQRGGIVGMLGVGIPKGGRVVVAISDRVKVVVTAEIRTEREVGLILQAISILLNVIVRAVGP